MNEETKSEEVKLNTGITVFNVKPALLELNKSNLKLTLLDKESNKQLETVFDSKVSDIEKVVISKGVLIFSVGNGKYKVMFPTSKSSQDWLASFKQAGLKITNQNIMAGIIIVGELVILVVAILILVHARKT